MNVNTFICIALLSCFDSIPKFTSSLLLHKFVYLFCVLPFPCALRGVDGWKAGADLPGNSADSSGGESSASESVSTIRPQLHTSPTALKHGKTTQCNDFVLKSPQFSIKTSKPR